MAKIVIDARESGTSTGRYVDKLVEYLYKLQPELEATILTKPSCVHFIKSLAPNFEVTESNYKEFTFSEQLGFWWQVRRQKANLVHFAMIQQPVLYRGPTVTTVHDLTTARFNNPAKNWLIFKLKQLVYRWVIKRVAKKSNRIITPSEFVKSDLVNFTGIDPAKITVIYEAADKITAEPRPLEALSGKKFIMYVGRPTPHKNLERLVSAFEQLSRSDPKLILALVGKADSNYQRIKKLVDKKGLSQRVVFTGFVREGELRWLYEHTKAYVFPSLSEGFGLPGLEAMAHGAPVASSNATSLPEIYGEAAHYFNPLDVYEMAAKINNVLTDAALRDRLIKKGHAQAAKYSWQRMAEQTLDIYKKVLKT